MKNIFEIKSPGKVVVEISDTGIIISRKGMVNAINIGLTGGKTIPFSSITAVQFKKAGMTNGYIQFSILGGNEQKGGVFSAIKDENTIIFTKKYQKIALEIKEIVEYNINSAITKASVKDPMEQLKVLKELLDSEIITDEEFKKKKEQLLEI